VSVKVNVLKKLEENRGLFFSGEELAASLTVSRAAVWKAIKQLEEEGYQIEAVPNKGYCLATNNDLVSVEGIRTYLSLENKELDLHVDKVTESTNKDAKLAAINNGKHGEVFVALEQTAGRGRRGRSFISMKGNSIYMSIILKPRMNSSNVVLITTAASVAVHRAIAKVTGKVTQIKWVNDLYYQEKKICGILTEAVTDCESGMIDSIILGIGINFNTKEENIPDELKGYVGALFQGDSGNITRNELIAEIINQVLQLCCNLDDIGFLTDYRNNSMVLGKEIMVIGNEEPVPAKAVQIIDNGGLLVVYKDGHQEVLCTGEISIRIAE
jgi:BirA family biotin operon repressor/biotin-[acetyl-CoA-carboxylase] ligase